VKYLSTLQDKNDIIDNKFRKGSGSYELAKSIVRQGLTSLTESEKMEVGKEFRLSTSTVSGVFSKLRGLGLLGSTHTPPYTPSINIQEPNQQPTALHTPPTNPEPTASQEHATIADLERLETAIFGLTELLNDEEYEEGDEGNPDSDDPTQVNPPQPPMTPQEQRTILDDSSMKQMGTWVFAKNLLYFDFAKQGTFGGALEKFDGNWSDFVNIVIEDYFVRTSNVGIGLLSRKFA